MRIGGGIFGFVALTDDESPLWLVLALGLFGLLFCFVAWAIARRHIRLILLMRARKSAPVTATIFIRATHQPRGGDRLVAEITVGQHIWRGILTGWTREPAFAGQTHESRAWMHLSTGALLEVEIQGQILTPVPGVTRVKPVSALESVIRRVHL